MTIKSEIQSLSPSALIELFVLDTRNRPDGMLMYFHAGTNQLSQPVVWQGNIYQPLPVEAEGFDVTSKGTLPRPKIRVANVNGMFSAEVRKNDDLVGCKVIRKRTFSRYLDDANFLKTNRIINSMDPAAWPTYTTGTGAVSVSRVVDPKYGQVTRITKTAGAASDRAGIRCSMLGLTGNQYNGSLWCKRNTKLTAGYGLYIDAAALPSGYATLSIPVPTSVAQWEHLHSDSIIKSLTGAGTFYVWVEGPVGSSIDIYAPQLSLGAGLKDYDPTSARINQSADPNQHFPDDVWYVERKVSENRYVVEWELSSAFDLQGVVLPARQVVQNSCAWQYRGPECGYTGGYFDKNDQPCGPEQDTCPKRLESCEVRWRSTATPIMNFFGIPIRITPPLPFGGFPGATRNG